MLAKEIKYRFQFILQLSPGEILHLSPFNFFFSSLNIQKNTYRLGYFE